MNTLLWFCQALLALVFIYSGVCKSFYSRDNLVAKGQTGVADLSVSLIRFIGITEILGGMGIILPWWLQVASLLTPITAVCFGVLMILAAAIHYKRKEPRNVATNIVLLLISCFVAYWRFR